MKLKFRLLLNVCRRQKAIALITVMSLVAIMTVFILALFSMSRSEQVSARSNTEAERAREFADMAINLAMGQIWEGTKQDATNNGREIWASQPGAIRKYRNDGSFLRGFRLYSSRAMQVTGSENQMADASASPPADWATQVGRYVDLNEPVIRAPRVDAGGGTVPQLYFPIIDPRAYVRGVDGAANSTNVEGFWYGNFAGVRDPATIEDTNARLPMPVEWLYVLKDGTMGAMGQNGNTFQPAAGGTDATADNPIVARIAFWTDDESTKLNVNTASEPTNWSVPTFYHRRDQSWAYYQPTSFEYQRFPGHPATVALSTVLFPNQQMDTFALSYRPSQTAALTRLKERKERIYMMAPKVNSGGSEVASLPYWRFMDSDYDGNGSVDNANNNLQRLDISSSIKERLYASVDEFLFSENLVSEKRVFNDSSAGADAIFGNPRDVERTRFFLTAQSRIPELNMFGMPRVAIWPVADSALGNSYRTGYDQLIAFCSSLGAAGSTNRYYFQRRNSQSATEDVSIARNRELLGYLGRMMNQRMPGGRSFQEKYNRDSTQILVEIFDYIRSTNLYDGFLAPEREQIVVRTGKYATEAYPNGPAENHNEGTYYRRRPTDYKTFTPDRMSRNRTESNTKNSKLERLVDKSFPGHGQVIPTEYDGGSSGVHRGFGRFLTITEFGFHFLCTADGNPDKGSYRIRNNDPQKTVPPWPGFNTAKGQANRAISGGRTALRIKPERYNGTGRGTAIPRYVKYENGNRVESDSTSGQYDVWYSNFPPFPAPNLYGMGTNSGNHPGYDGQNWNISLPINDPLEPGEKMVQMMLQIELTSPSAGYTKLHPDFSIVIEGASSFKLDGQNLFETGAAGRLIWKSGYELMDTENVRGVGGSVNSAALASNRRAKAPSVRMPPDPDYDITANSAGDVHRGLRNFELLSKFVKVTGDQMTFSGAPIVAKIYAGHTIQQSNLIQEINIPAPASLDLPTPHLVTLSADNETWQDNQGNTDRQKIMDAPSWWIFNYGGAIGRFTKAGGTLTPRANAKDLSEVDVMGARILGRIAGWGNIATDRLSMHNVPYGNAGMFGYDASNGNFSSRLLDPVTPAADVPNDAFGDTGLVDMNDQPTGPRRGVTPGLRASPDNRGSDVVFTMVPKHSDFRLIMAKKVVPGSDWVVHPKADNLLTTNGQFFAHNLTRFDSDAEVAFDAGTATLKLVPNAPYSAAKRPDTAADGAYATPINLAKRYGDFDNGPGVVRDGAWINKPDEGNAPVNWRTTTNDDIKRTPVAYLNEVWWLGAGEDPGDSFMTPNRVVPSPGMFGSLPTGVMADDPWKTLLFRPHTLRTGASGMHPGGPSSAGGLNPADHYIMDLFWMPVVEPYAISEPFSTAGKININYQIVPFHSYIRRATGVHAAMKGEVLSCVAARDAGVYKNAPTDSNNAQILENMGGDYWSRGAWRDKLDNAPGDTEYATKNQVRFWHRNINVEKRTSPSSATIQGTLRQFEDRFNFLDATAPGLFRAASQICEVHLIPEKIAGTVAQSGDTNPGTPFTKTDMAAFWSSGLNNPKELTGDNTRERPYANIYAKISTQSNTFRIHLRAQTIRKARSTPPNEFDVEKDGISAEYRGSALIERHINPADPRLPDYARSPEAPPLDDFYRFRVLELKRFNP